MSEGKCVLYGSYGYTGDLIARFARERGMDLVLAGRDEARLKEQAAQRGHAYRVADLSDAARMREILSDATLAIHCAGPFGATYRPIAEACIDTGTHYIDVCGDVDVLNGLASLDGRARAAGVMLTPGVAFAIMSTNVMALHLKERLPEATHLALAFHNRGGVVSRGTAGTALTNLPRGAVVRRDGELVPVPMGSIRRAIDYGDGDVSPSAVVRFGDVVTAWHATGIANIEVYTAMPGAAARVLSTLQPLLPLIQKPFIAKRIQRRIARRPLGPSDAQRDAAHIRVWGEARDARGNVVTSRLRIPDGYSLTMRATLDAAGRILRGEAKPGFQAPASAFGSDALLGLEGVGVFEDA